VPVGLWAAVALLQWVTAERARRPPPREETLAVLDHTGRLLAGEQQARFARRRFARRVLCGDELSRNENYPVSLGVVAELQQPDGPRCFDGFFERQLSLGGGERRGGQVGEDLREPACQQQDLLLFELQGYQPVSLAGLEIKHPTARRADRSHCHADWAGQVERSAQFAALWGGALGDVQLASSTRGPAGE